MPQYDWDSDFSVAQQSIEVNQTQQLTETVATRQLSHVEGGRNPFDGSDFLAYPHHLEEFLQPGFRYLDDAMKQYWSGIRVPTKDSYRFMRIKISGGDKGLLVWGDDLKEGRARLPLAAISREGAEFNYDKYSPAYHAMTLRYLSSSGDQAAKVFRPIPWLVNYKITIWAEHKRDAEYILFQILTRFNPLAEFKLFDGKIQGNVQLRFDSSSDTSDKDMGFDQYANVRREITTTAEAWLSIPEKIVKTVLGRTTNFKETSGEILTSIAGNQSRIPIQSISDAKNYYVDDSDNPLILDPGDYIEFDP